MKIVKLEQCTRCGEAALERLSTHTTCFACNYAPDIDAADFYIAIPDVVLRAIAAERARVDEKGHRERVCVLPRFRCALSGNKYERRQDDEQN